MATIEHKGKSYEVDEDGFLLKGAEDWDENWVDYVKSVEGIAEITDEHQKVIDALQEYYKKNGIAPMVRILSKTTGFPLKRIYELFPSGPGKGACKMAGLPKPTVSRLTYTLSRLGFLHADRRMQKYQVGNAVLALGYPLLGSMTWRHLARPMMNDLADHAAGSVSVCATG